MDLYLKRTSFGLIWNDELTQQACEKFPVGRLLTCKVTQPRNPKFHDKYMALLRLGFRYWEPAEVDTKYGKPVKNFDHFRGQVAILAGFYEVVPSLVGKPSRLVPKSISFAKMNEDDFTQLYSATIDVLLRMIFVDYSEDEVVRMAEEEILRFSS